jgi:hypothetical protein
VKVLRIQKDGHYHHGIKITVIFAIELGDPALLPHVRGSLERPQRWIRCVLPATLEDQRSSKKVSFHLSTEISH